MNGTFLSNDDLRDYLTADMVEGEVPEDDMNDTDDFEEYKQELMDHLLALSIVLDTARLLGRDIPRV